MASRYWPLCTGDIIERYGDDERSEIAAVIRLPCAVWERLTAGEEEYMADAANVHPNDPAARLEWKIGCFLMLLTDEWVERISGEADADLDDDAPF